jgi:acid phosphatase type 7
MKLSIAILTLGIILMSIYSRTTASNRPKKVVTPAPINSKASPINSKGDPVIAAAGDIACDPSDASPGDESISKENCRMQATSDLLVGRNLAAVLPLGDNQYEVGSLAKFQQSYASTWGRLLAITHPVAGNHE